LFILKEEYREVSMDKMKWSLKSLYSSFEDNNFESDMKKFEKKITEINNWTAKKLKDYDNKKTKIEEFIKHQIRYRKLLTKLKSFCRLTLSVESDNTKALNYIEKINKKQINVTKSEAYFQFDDRNQKGR
jgi:oligoendopeptidase F